MDLVPTSLLVPLTVVVGEEDLLVARAVSAVVRAARELDPDVDWVAALSVAALATVVSLLTSLATPDFTSGAPADEYQGKHEAPDPRHHVAD